MTILIILFYIILLTLSNLIIKRRFLKVFINLYLLWWSTLLIISTFNLYDMYAVSDKTYFIMIISNLMFFFGYVILSNTPTNKILKIDFKQKKSSDKWLLRLQFLLFPYLVYYFYRYQMLLGVYGHTYARTIRYQLGFLFSNVIESAIYSYVITPIISIMGVLIAIKFLNKEYKNSVFVLMLINVLINTQIGLGRFGYFEIIMYLFIIYFIYSNSTKSNIKRVSFNFKKIGQFIAIIIFVFGLAIIMSSTLLTRQGVENTNIYNILEGFDTLFNQAISYFTGPFRALDSIIQNPTLEATYYGRLTFGGVERLFSFIFDLFGVNLQTAYEKITPAIQTPIQIGVDTYFNAFYTGILNHYLDLRIFGVIVFPLIHGFFVKKVHVYFLKKPNYSSLGMLVIVIYDALMTSLRWSYENPSAWIILLVLYYFSQKSEKNNINKLYSPSDNKE